MSPSEHTTLSIIEQAPDRQITVKTLADALCCDERRASGLLLDLQIAGEVRSRSEATGRGPARKVYFIPEDTCA